MVRVEKGIIELYRQITIEMRASSGNEWEWIYIFARF